MSEKIPCSKCGAMVLPSTFERTGGLCMPCKNGNRESIENSKAFYAQQKELDKSCPFRALWCNLVQRIFSNNGNIEILSEDEKLYFAVNELVGEIYNGGFEQYFHNSSGSNYRLAEYGLIRIEAKNSVALLRKAKTELFGDDAVPKEQSQRWLFLDKPDSDKALNKLDEKFYQDPDGLNDKLELFAIDIGLVESA